jgi:hypothetical protein
MHGDNFADIRGRFGNMIGKENLMTHGQHMPREMTLQDLLDMDSSEAAEDYTI